MEMKTETELLLPCRSGAFCRAYPTISPLREAGRNNEISPIRGPVIVE